MWIKVCANTSREDALLAAEAGANAVGFVFAESKRQVTPAKVRTITPFLPEAVEKIGVFVDASFASMAATIGECGLTGVQIHSGCEVNATQRLRDRFSDRLRILKVIHYRQGLQAELRTAEDDANIDAVLVDSRTATLLGGTGVTFDWNSAQGIVIASPLQIVVAGGLTPENVGDAVAILRPWGVDVASGVEASPGMKDPEKVWAFIENARIAAAKFGSADELRV